MELIDYKSIILKDIDVVIYYHLIEGAAHNIRFLDKTHF